MARFLVPSLATLIVAAASCSPGGSNPKTDGFGSGTGGAWGAGSTGAGAGMGTGSTPGQVASGGDPGQVFIDTDSGSAGGTTGSGGAPNTGGTTVVPPVPTTPVDAPILIDDCATGPLDAATVQALKAGGSTAGARLLYPYDNTVFPVGLLAPIFQWEQTGAADAVYVHLKSEKFEYFGCFAGNANFRQNIPENVWQTAGVQSGGGADPLLVELSVKSGGSVIGPLKETLVIARGKLKGDLFYNTYTSPQANNNGAVMKLRLGDPKPSVLLTQTGVAPFGPCWSCHSLSANGNVLVAQAHQYPGGPYSSASFNLKANPAPQGTGNPVPPAQATFTLASTTAEMGMGAVYPDGTKVLTMGSPGDSSVNFLFPDGAGNVPAMIGPKASMLLDVNNGQPLTMQGWNVQYAKMPSFSPDGSKVVFNWHEDSNGHTLAVADFDTTTNTVSNVKVIYKHATLYPGWPWITPDNLEVVFVLGNTPDYVSAYPSRPAPAQSSLWTVDIATGNARQLARANGYPKDGSPTYMPRPGRDEHYEYFPTMSPIAAGGYFWVFFTSRRTYGNIMTDANTLGVADAPTKKIWVTALNIRTGDIIADPSNPPFYLPGQEDASGNIRAFAALEPCKAEGATCETGVDCCGGKCCENLCGPCPPPPPPPPGEPPPPPPPQCSELDEKCSTAQDCCDPKAKCLNSFCVIVEPPR